MIENKFRLIDSNILIYAYDKDEGQKNQIANDILKRAIKNEIKVVLSTQNISEFYINITKKIGKPIIPEFAKQEIIDLISLSNIKIIIIKDSTVLNAIDISIKYNLSYWDSLIASVMYENDIDTIITENESDFKKIPWLNVINPFK